MCGDVRINFFMWLLVLLLPFCRRELPALALSPPSAASASLDNIKRHEKKKIDPPANVYGPFFPGMAHATSHDSPSPYLNNSCIDLQLHFISFIQPFSVTIYLNEQPHRLSQVMGESILCLKEEQITLRIQETKPSKVSDSPAPSLTILTSSAGIRDRRWIEGILRNLRDGNEMENEE
jgi:hypothetical protein